MKQTFHQGEELQLEIQNRFDECHSCPPPHDEALRSVALEAFKQQ